MQLHEVLYKYDAENKRIMRRKVYPIDLQANLDDGWVFDPDQLSTPKEAEKPAAEEVVDNTGPLKPIEEKKKLEGKKTRVTRKPGRPKRKAKE